MMRPPRRLNRIGHTGENDGEFVTANPRDTAGVGSGIPKATADRLEQRVTGPMTKRIVNLLEAVEVQEKKRRRLAMNDLGQFIQKCMAVRQAGESVGKRQTTQIFFVLAADG